MDEVYLLEKTNEHVVKSGEFMNEIAPVPDESESARWGPKHAGAQILASQYTYGKRIQEIISVIISVALLAYNGFCLIRYFPLDKCFIVFPAGVAGIMLADFFSGIVHWAADTWGTVEWPILGKSLIRPFREHHIDPTGITRHDFIETNGDNFAIIVPFLAIMAFRFTSPETNIAEYYTFAIFVYMIGVFVSLTNQVWLILRRYYKRESFVIVFDWQIVCIQGYVGVMYSPVNRPHWTVHCIEAYDNPIQTAARFTSGVILITVYRALSLYCKTGTLFCRANTTGSCTLAPFKRALPDRKHVVLRQVGVHHVNPHDVYYCITTGWLNGPLDAIDFWKTLEDWITRLTGALPRSDDMKWAHMKAE